jgi:hypothetical protein
MQMLPRRRFSGCPARSSASFRSARRLAELWYSSCPSCVRETDLVERFRRRRFSARSRLAIRKLIVDLGN